MSFANTITAFERVAAKLAGVTVIYRRPGVGDVPLTTARWGSTRTETTDEQGVTLRGQVRDLIVEAALLVLPGVGATLPAAGDQVLETTNGTTRIYEVRPVGGDRPWRWHDTAHQWYRIHVVHHATE